MLKYVAAENLSIGDVLTLDKDNGIIRCTHPSKSQQKRIGVATEPIPLGSLVFINETGLAKVYKYPEPKNEPA